MNSIYVKWQIQCRLSRKHAWRPKGTYETRGVARFYAGWMRGATVLDRKTGVEKGKYGFGNTRVVRKEVKR